MAAGRVYHWKHGWIPVSPEAKAFRAGRGPNPTDVRKVAGADLPSVIKRDGGFTYNPRSGGLLEVGKNKGFAVAVPGTEEIVGNGDVDRESFARGVATVLMKHRAAIAKGAVVGGWYSPDRDQYMVELTEIHPADDRAGAIRLGRKRNQEAIFDLATGDTIPTGGTGDATRSEAA